MAGAQGHRAVDQHANLLSFFLFAWACLVWEGMVLQDIWKQEDLSTMGFRGHWGLGTRTLLHMQKAGDNSSPPKLLQRLQGGQGGYGSGDPCAERWETALFHTCTASSPCYTASPRCPGLSGAFYGNIILRKPLLTGVKSLLPTA